MDSSIYQEHIPTDNPQDDFKLKQLQQAAYDKLMYDWEEYHYKYQALSIADGNYKTAEFIYKEMDPYEVYEYNALAVAQSFIQQTKL